MTVASRREWAGPYHAGVQNVILLVGAGLALPVIALLAIRGRSRVGQAAGTSVIIGIVVGLLGMIVALPVSVDLVPDELEGALAAVTVAVVTALLLVGTLYRRGRG